MLLKGVAIILCILLVRSGPSKGGKKKDGKELKRAGTFYQPCSDLLTAVSETSATLIDGS